MKQVRCWRVLAVATLLFAVVGVLYAPVRSYPFIQLDDADYVTENAFVRTGISAANVRWALTAHHSGHWHPLTWLSLMADCHWSGAAPAALHLGNVALHAAGVALLLVAFVEATGSLWWSAFAAALFALHPLRVESVAWIAARKDVLSGFFVALTLWAWARYAKAPSAPRYGLALGAFALGMTAKPTLSVVPCGLLLLDWWPLARSARIARLVAEKLPFLGVAAVTLTQTWAAQRAAGATTFEDLPLATRAGNAVWHLARYLAHTVWPIDLGIFYPLRNATPGEVVAAGTGLVAVTVILWMLRARRPWFLMGWLWFAGMVVPVSGLVQFGGQSIADRYTYLPHIGFALALPWGLADAARRLRVPHVVVAVSAFVLLAALAARTHDQLRYWKDSVTLFERTLAVTDGNYMIHNNLGVVLEAAGDREGAARHYTEAARINPTWPDARNNLGLVHAWRGDLTGAASHFEAALRVRPQFARAENNLGTALAQLGDFDGAIVHYERAVALAPTNFEARYALADALERRGRHAEAADQYARLLSERPGFAPAVAALQRLGAAAP